MARSRSRLLSALVLTALTLAIAGCGGGGDKSAATGITSATGGTTESEAPTSSTETSTQGSTPAPPKPGAKSNPVASLPPADQIDYAIKGVLASGVPSLACDQTATENYVKTTFGTRAGCQKSTVPGSAATSVDVTGIKVKGGTATATARPTDGPSDGETIKVKLLRQHGVWKVDSLRSNAPVGP